MKAKQLSVFLENKSGRLTEVTEALGAAGINLSAMSIADNSDFGILRCIVSDPDKAYKVLKEAHFERGAFRREDHRCDRLRMPEHQWFVGYCIEAPVG